MLYSLKNLVRGFSLILSVLGILSLLIFHDQFEEILPPQILNLLLIFFVFFLSVLLISLLNRNKSGLNETLINFKLGKFTAYLITSAMIGAFICSIFINSTFFVTILLFLGLIVSIILTRYSYNLAFFLVIFLFMSYILSIYAHYPPPLGGDAYRDIRVAIITMENGMVGGVTNPAYQIPIVSIMYSFLSIILSLSLNYASALLGLLYLILTAMLTFIISKKISNKINSMQSFISVILLLSIPLTIRWTVEFIPQAYSLMLFLFLLLIIIFNKSINIKIFILVLPFILTIPLIHAGSALWIIGFFFSLFIIVRCERLKNAVPYIFLKTVLLILIPLTLIVFTYTSVLNAVTLGFRNFRSLLFNVITLTSGSSGPSSISSSGDFIATFLCYTPLVISVTLAFSAWLLNRHVERISKIFIEVGFFYGLIMLAGGLLGPIFFPDAVFDRYLGFGALLLLSIIASKGFGSLLQRGKIGQLFLTAITTILIISISFNGLLSPDSNVFNIQSSYMVQYPPNWEDIANIKTISMYLDNGDVLTDWATGRPMTDLMISMYSDQQKSDLFYSEGGFLYTYNGTIKIVTLGTYGLVVDYNYITRYIDRGGVFVYRPGSIDNLNLLLDGNETQLYGELTQNYNKVFMGNIEIII